MFRIKAEIPAAQLRRAQRQIRAELERAALNASDQAASKASQALRTRMRGAKLGGLANAVAATSDEKRGGRVFPKGAGFSASGTVHLRTRSDRTVGAIESYAEGATITPRRGRFLWIPTRNIPARAGRYRMTPERYRQGGFEQRIGPLTFVPGRNAGEAMLIVRDVTTLRSGRAGSALARKSRISAKREARDALVAFIGIRSTSRATRIDVDGILRAHQAMLPELMAQASKRR